MNENIPIKKNDRLKGNFHKLKAHTVNDENLSRVAVRGVFIVMAIVTIEGAISI